MFLTKIAPVSRYLRRRQLVKIAKTVRDGKVPKGISFDTIMEALKLTKPRAPVEMFGILQAKQYRDGELLTDHGVVGVRSVTVEFANLLVDNMVGVASSTIIDVFKVHAMGDGSAAEATGDSELVAQQDGRNVGTNTHGATSNVMASTATVTAGSAYTVIEHALFDTTAAAERLLDRTVIDSFQVATDDEVEWTYSLTVATGG